MDELGINLPLLLEYISYSDHIKELGAGNKPIRRARGTLLSSRELPNILRNWETRPTERGRGMSSKTPARATMRRFAVDCIKRLVVREIHAVKDHLKLKTNLISKDILLSIDFGDICRHIQEDAPTMFECYRAAAWSPIQEKRNIHKSPDKVCCSLIPFHT